MARIRIPKSTSGFTHAAIPSTPGKIINKNSRQAPMLPGRRAMNQLLKGDPTQQSLGNYAKMTPSGADAPQGYLGIQDATGDGS